MRDILRFRPELVHPSVFIAPGAMVIGDVTLARDSSVWFNAVLRGDTDSIQIGPETNVQDLAVLHCDAGVPCTIGARVTLGHAAIVHGATVEDDCLIGIRAVVMNRARIGAGSLIAVGALVTEGVEIPPRSVVMGVPGKVVRQVTDEDWQRIRHAANHYVQAAQLYRRSSGTST